MDVYRDLRDRRLLVIAVALLLAMVAVPFLVKPSDPMPVTSTAVPAAGAEELDAVTVAANPALRDYRRRLDSISAQNPFEQQLTGVAGGAAGGGGGGGGNLPTQDSTTSVAGASAVAATTGGVGDVAAAPEISPESTAPPEETDPPSPQADSSELPTEDTEVATVVGYTIDVKIGPVGDVRDIHDVEEMDLLPSKKGAFIQYVGSDLDGSGSDFVLSEDVIGADGDGNCAPSRADCRFLRLQVGDEEQLELGSSGTVYRIKLLGVTRLERAAETDGTSGG